MPRFKYVATSSDGSKVEGKIEAPSAGAARDMLTEQRLEPEDISPSRSLLQMQVIAARVKQHELMHLSRQLAAFVRAGVPILDGLEVIAAESENPTLQGALLEASDALRQGDRLSDALGRHSRAFGRYYIDMIRAAELTGELDKVLDQLADYLEREIEARQRIRSALTYPTILVVVGIGALVVLTVFVLPRFRSFFASVDAELPLASRVLISITDWVGDWWWALNGGLALIILLVIIGLRTERGRSLMDRFLLRMPVVGEVVRFGIIERFCRTLAAMVSAGVTLPEAIPVVSDATNNFVFKTRLEAVLEQMLEGEGLADPMAASGLFPPTVIQMVRVGENTGTLDDQLVTAASFYERELTYRVQRMTTLFEPVVVIGLGVVIGFIAIAVVSAMFAVYQEIGSI